MNPSVIARVQEVLKSDFDIAEPNIMAPNSHGGYHLFGLFDVEEQAGLTAVYRAGVKIREFSGMRLAVSWCIAEKFQQNLLSMEICRLDRDYIRLRDMQHTLTQITERIKDRDRRFVARVKSEDNHRRLQQVQGQLSKCVSRAKYLQIKGFNDEIARTRRTPSNRTSRNGAGKSRRTKD
jgi:hypothetical protein